MASLPLPESVVARLTSFTCAVEDCLQAEVHAVDSATAEHPAFDAGYVESALVRAVIASAAASLGGDGLVVKPLANGGGELTHVLDGVERRFRLRRAERDARGRLVVTVNSDSFLVSTVPDPTLFDDPANLTSEAPQPQQWVLAYRLHPGTHTFVEVCAARAAALIGDSAPYRLDLEDITAIPFTAPMPPDFRSGNDDLDLPDEDEGRDEQAD